MGLTIEDDEPSEDQCPDGGEHECDDEGVCLGCGGGES
jgi:hypothetical protein